MLIVIFFLFFSAHSLEASLTQVPALNCQLSLLAPDKLKEAYFEILSLASFSADQKKEFLRQATIDSRNLFELPSSMRASEDKVQEGLDSLSFIFSQREDFAELSIEILETLKQKMSFVENLIEDSKHISKVIREVRFDENVYRHVGFLKKNDSVFLNGNGFVEVRKIDQLNEEGRRFYKPEDLVVTEGRSVGVEISPLGKWVVFLGQHARRFVSTENPEIFFDWKGGFSSTMSSYLSVDERYFSNLQWSPHYQRFVFRSKDLFDMNAKVETLEFGLTQLKPEEKNRLSSATSTMKYDFKYFPDQKMLFVRTISNSKEFSFYYDLEQLKIIKVIPTELEYKLEASTDYFNVFGNESQVFVFDVKKRKLELLTDDLSKRLSMGSKKFIFLEKTQSFIQVSSSPLGFILDSLSFFGLRRGSKVLGIKSFKDFFSKMAFSENEGYLVLVKEVGLKNELLIALCHVRSGKPVIERSVPFLNDTKYKLSVQNNGTVLITNHTGSPVVTEIDFHELERGL